MLEQEKNFWDYAVDFGELALQGMELYYTYDLGRRQINQGIPVSLDSIKTSSNTDKKDYNVSKTDTTQSYDGFNYTKLLIPLIILVGLFIIIKR